MNKLYKYWLFLLIISIIIVIISIIIFFLFMKNKNENIKKVCINDNCFNVEVAKTAEEKANGLMFRESMDKDKGMLFIYEEEGFYSFWMKNTLIPLDIIWIDKDQKIIYIEKNAQPCKTNICKSYGPDQKSKYILEINAGLTDNLKIKPEDKIMLDL